MSHEVILPALGMAQDTGKLIAWLKQPGDPVAVGDVLFEVETDKSVAEVEAQASGYLTDVTAQAGEDVPVGQVIARISDTADGRGTSAPHRAPAPEPEPEPEAEPKVAPKATPAAAPAAVPKAAPGVPVAKAPTAPRPSGDTLPRPSGDTGAQAPGERIFASPKARRLAAEEGLDLARLAAAGQPQPFHASDLAILRNLPAGQNSPTGVLPPLTSLISAQVPRQGVAGFLDRMEREGGIALPAAALFVAFAATALRAASGADGDLAIAVLSLDGTTTTYGNPDRARLSVLPETDAAPDLAIRDLTGSRLTHLQLAATEVPTLSIAETAESYSLTLTFSDRQLTEAQAIALITDLAGRLAEPLLSVL